MSSPARKIRAWRRERVQDEDADPRLADLSLAAVGLHKLMRDRSWTIGPLPDDPVRVARQVRQEPAAVTAAWEEVRKLWEASPSGEGIVFPDLEDERQDALARAARSRKGARTTNARRWDRSTDRCTDDVTDRYSDRSTDTSTDRSAIATRLTSETTSLLGSVGNTPTEDSKPSSKALGNTTDVVPEKRAREAHPDTEALGGAHADAIRAWKPDSKPQTGSAASRAAYDALLRLDGRSLDRATAVLDWLFSGAYEPRGDFDWRPNVLSGKSLRKHFDRLEAEMQRRPTSTGPPGRQSNVERSLAALQEFRDSLPPESPNGNPA